MLTDWLTNPLTSQCNRNLQAPQGFSHTDCISGQVVCYDMTSPENSDQPFAYGEVLTSVVRSLSPPWSLWWATHWWSGAWPSQRRPSRGWAMQPRPSPSSPSWCATSSPSVLGPSPLHVPSTSHSASCPHRTASSWWWPAWPTRDGNFCAHEQVPQSSPAFSVQWKRESQAL